MIDRIRGTMNHWNKRRRLFQVRRAFERAGYSVEHYTDAQVEAALTGGERSIEEVPISAKILSLALRRLPKRNKANATADRSTTDRTHVKTPAAFR